MTDFNPTEMDVMTPTARRIDALVGLQADAGAVWTYLETATVATDAQAVYVAVDDDVMPEDWRSVIRLIELAGWDLASDIGEPGFDLASRCYVWRLPLAVKEV